MEIILEKIGRRFNREWIFRNIDYTFKTGKSYAVLGINGSGKSTLLQVLCGVLSPSEGKIYFKDKAGKPIDVERVFKEVSIAAPYLELIEELTLLEAITFHFEFKNRVRGISNSEIVDLLGMQSSRNKQIKYFSSGMKQRVKLALAFLSDTNFLFLDEPCSNLDEQGIAWYQQLIKHYTQGRLVLVCSNQPVEYEFCEERLLISDYK